MKEKNTDKLREALDRLRPYEAPASAWEGIAEGLHPVLADQLPSYQPAAGVWNSISREMERADETAAQARFAKQRSLPLRSIAGIAAAIVLLISLGFGISRYQDRQIVTLAYSQEVAPPPTLQDWDDNEDSFRNAIAEIEIRNEPGLNSLRYELDELTDAKEEIKAMLVAYGNDPGVIRQLVEIERDRSDIYRRIIVEL
jgi:hypothetical protein